MSCEITCVVDLPCICGECPVWHAAERRLYWVDIPTGRLFRYDPVTGSHEICHEDRPIGGFTLQADGSLLLFRDGGNVALWRDGRIVQTVIESLPELAPTRFNDVCADPDGRVFCGTLSAPGLSARLYRLDRDGTPILLQDGYGTANGMGFSPDGRHCYFNDTGSSNPCTYRFDYEAATGALTHRRVFRRTRDHNDPGKPDGLAVDIEGCVWTGRWQGASLLRQAPDGRILDTLPLPVQNVTSLCFGGNDLRDIYVTTAGGDHRSEKEPLAGSLFRVHDYPTIGLPRFVSRVAPFETTSVFRV